MDVKNKLLELVNKTFFDYYSKEVKDDYYYCKEQILISHCIGQLEWDTLTDAEKQEYRENLKKSYRKTHHTNNSKYLFLFTDLYPEALKTISHFQDAESFAFDSIELNSNVEKLTTFLSIEAMYINEHRFPLKHVPYEIISNLIKNIKSEYQNYDFSRIDVLYKEMYDLFLLKNS